jgi:putative addiction module component (TIGR02574 family)
MTPQLNDILRLPLAERIRWAETIWDSIVSDEAHAATYRISEEQKSILREEVASYRADPDGGMSWEEARDRIRKG